MANDSLEEVASLKRRLQARLRSLCGRVLLAGGAVGPALAIPALRGYLAVGVFLAGALAAVLAVVPWSSSNSATWRSNAAMVVWFLVGAFSAAMSVGELPDRRAAGMLYTSVLLILVVVLMLLGMARQRTHQPRRRQPGTDLELVDVEMDGSGDRGPQVPSSSRG